MHGGSGGQVGTVRSIILDQGGQVETLVIEPGGVLGIGEKVVAVPWTEIDLTPGESGVVARSLQADNVANFGLFDDGEAGATGPRSFRAAELEGDYVTLQDRAGYGYVRDLLFDQNGQLQALIVAHDADGYYACPFYGHDDGFEPGRDTYAVPYAEDDLEAHEPFEYDAWRDSESLTDRVLGQLADAIGDCLPLLDWTSFVPQLEQLVGERLGRDVDLCSVEIVEPSLTPLIRLA